MFDPIVLRTKTVYMQRINDFIRVQHRCHASGEVSLDHCTALARKFRGLYPVHLGKDARYRRKKAELGNAHLLPWQQPNVEALLLCLTLLLVTGGDHHPGHRLEPNLRNVCDRHGLVLLTDCEFMLHYRPGRLIPGGGHRKLTAQAG